MIRALAERTLLLALAFLAWGPAARASGGEPVEQFLAALRQQGFYDEALDYLKQIEAHSHLSDSIRQRALYDQAAVLLESVSLEADKRARDARLARAEELFTRFRKEFPQHELSAAATSQIANLLIERGRSEVQSAGESGHNDQVLSAAREFFEQARRQLITAERDLDAQLQKLPKLVPPDEKELEARKRQLAGEVAQARLLSASVDYELAGTFEAKSSEAAKHTRTAAKSYAALYEAYRTRSVGLLARWWEGRCYQELGQFKQALGCFQDLIALGISPETETIRTKATRSALECWTHESQEKYQEAIECGKRWEATAGSREPGDDALAIRYLTALACQAQSKALPPSDPGRKKLAGEARQYVNAVARHPGQFQRPAKMMLVALAGGKDKKNQTAESATFAEAYEQARQALERMQQASADAALASQGGDRSAIEAQEEKKRQSAEAAAESLRLALNKSDAKTPIEDLNSARYYLCYLAWDAGRYHDAAVLGEFLASRYPDGLPGRQGARIALAACVRLYSEAKATDKDFERAHIRRVAEIIFKKWPDQEESDEAALTMLNFAVADHEFAKALEYLGKVSTKSARRGQAELRAGQALWSAYLRALQEPADERPSGEQLEELKKLAQDILGQGIARMQKAGEVDATLAAAVLALAQVCVETGKPDKAIVWLEHPKMGPLTLVKAGSPIAAREGFAAETCKVALRAYVGVQPQQLKKAEEVMDLLEKLVEKNPRAAIATNLTAIYISLGRELEQHLQELRKSGKTRELDAVSKAFEVFLDRITKRETGGSYASLNWVGETYYSLGSGFDTGAGPPSPKARDYFQKATLAYHRLLEAAEKDPKFKEQPDSLIPTKLRIADCETRAGNFDGAIKTLIELLKEKPTRLNVQIQAAELYQAHGAVDPKGYAQAIVGAAPGRDGKNVVWGWAKISQLTVNRPEFKETFHQARLNMAEARHAYAQTQTDDAKRKKILESAKQDLWMTYKLRPTLGGEETATRYDRLLKRIQKSLGENELGLTEFKNRDAAAAAPAT